MNLPPYSIFPDLSDAKITLRQISISDFKHIFTICFYEGIKALTITKAMEMQEKINKDYHEGNSIHWGITDNLTNNIVGTCGYYRGFDKEAGELGCILLPQYRGHGFMELALKLAIDFGFNKIGLKRIKAVTTVQNQKAIQLLSRLQFIKVRDIKDDEVEYELKNALLIK